MVVSDTVVVEVKVVEKIAPVHRSQVLSYLRLSGLTVGLLINFNIPVLKDGIRRIVRGYGGPLPSASPARSASPGSSRGKASEAPGTGETR